MSTAEIYAVALDVIRILEELKVEYELGGSLASSLHGIPRSTLDADLVADLKPSDVPRFCELLGNGYYAQAEAIETAVRNRRSFNIIHTATMMKVDIFPVKDNPFSITEFTPRRRSAFPPPDGPIVWVSSPEDIILPKIRWYLDGGKVAERQIQDAIGVLDIHRADLDFAYLKKWAQFLNVTDLLVQAAQTAGFQLP